MGVEVIISAIVGIGSLWIAFLNYRLNKDLQKKETENKALKETLANVHNKVQVVIMNNPVFSQAPEEIQKTLITVSDSTSGSIVIAPISVTDGGNAKVG